MPGLIAALLVVRLIYAAMNQSKSPGAKAVARPGYLLFLVLLPIAAGLTMLVAAGGWAFLPVLAAVLVLMFPWTAARRVFVPLGLPKIAGYLARLPSASFTADPAGGSAMAAAWALLHRRSRSDADIAWVADRIGKLSPTRGAGLVAAGLFAVTRGDLEAARKLMHGARELDPRARPRVARRAASGFLAADAAARGAWSEIPELSISLLDDGRQAWLLAGVAKALLIEPDAPRGWALWVRWLIAPNRRATMPLVERALAALDGAFISSESAPVAPIEMREADALGRAMALHAGLLAEREVVRAEELRAIAQAWDEVLESASLADELSSRASALGAASAGPALGALRETVDEDLAALALEAKVALADLTPAGPTATRVRAALRDRLLREIELASDAIRLRTDERRELPGADEWREWSALASAYSRGVRLAGAELRRLAFYKVHNDATHYAVWLFNERKERALGNAIFRFLLVEAHGVDDETSAALQQKNIDCGI